MNCRTVFPRRALSLALALLCAGNATAVAGGTIVFDSPLSGQTIGLTSWQLTILQDQTTVPRFCSLGVPLGCNPFPCLRQIRPDPVSLPLALCLRPDASFTVVCRRIVGLGPSARVCRRGRERPMPQGYIACRQTISRSAHISGDGPWTEFPIIFTIQ